MRSTDELTEQAGDWSLMRLLLERPGDDWRQRLLAESRDTIDPELTSAVQMAQAEGNDYFHEVLFGADGLLTSRESDYRFERDRGAVLADLEGMRKRFGFSWQGSEPADHILALIGLMAHIVSRQAKAVQDNNIGEAVYLEGIAEWLRRGHLGGRLELDPRVLPVACRPCSRATGPPGGRERKAGAPPIGLDPKS